MKIRNDFVSNSSSSSYVICGKIFEADELSEMFDGELKSEINDGSVDAWTLEEKINEKIKQSGLDPDVIQCVVDGYDGSWNGQVLIGMNPNKMNNNQTFGDFKKNVVGKIKNLGLKCAISDVSIHGAGSDASGLTFIEECG